MDHVARRVECFIRYERRFGVGEKIAIAAVPVEIGEIDIACLGGGKQDM